MPSTELQKYLKNLNKKQFTNRTFEDFREELLQYANDFYRDQIVDFSEASLGGMLLDFAAIVGDSLVYYSEQQFNELNYQTATDPVNIVKHLQRANIKNSKPTPSSVNLTFFIEVSIDISSTPDNVVPDQSYLPVIKKGTAGISQNGIIFTLQEDVDFSEGYEQETGDTDIEGNVATLFLTKTGLATSGEIIEESITFDNDNSNYFLSYKLQRTDATNIISVFDEDNNEFYEVDYLTQNTVFKKSMYNKNYIDIKPAPRRFILEEDYLTGETFLRFGNGEGMSVKDDIFSNPAELMLPIKNKDNFARLDLDPNSLLKSSTLGISPKGKTLTILYKSGGGESHNISANTINSFSGEPIVNFPNVGLERNENIIASIINSMTLVNREKSLGGTNALSFEELIAHIPKKIKSQSRIITHEDLISRIMTMPSEFGRVHKIAAYDNIHSANSKDIYILCKDSDDFYVEASDSIKSNLSAYLNEYRLIGNNFNILDVPVYNFSIDVKIKVKSGYEIETTIIEVIDNIVKNARFDLLGIGEPININNIEKLIKEIDGVFSIVTPTKSFISTKTNLDAFYDSDLEQNFSYNRNYFNPQTLYKDGFIYPEEGGIFELKYNFKDINIVA